MVLFLSGHLLVRLRAGQVSMGFSAEPNGVCTQWISARHLLWHVAFTAIDDDVRGMRDHGFAYGIRRISAISELVCILRLGLGWQKDNAVSSSMMLFSASE